MSQRWALYNEFLHDLKDNHLDMAFLPSASCEVIVLHLVADVSVVALAIYVAHSK